MAQKYVMWGDVNNIPFITLSKGKFECILKSISFSPSLLKYACCYCTNLTSVSFPELTAISGQYAMEYAFIGCTNLTSVSFPKLTTISGNYTMEATFAQCTNLTSVSFPELTAISGQYAMGDAFTGCTNLTSVSFPKLTTLTYPSTALSRIGNSTLTVHLPKALSSLGITNNGGNTSSSYCSFVYDL